MNLRKPETRKAILAKFGGRCAYCGWEINNLQMQMDHIVAKNNGGTNDYDNLNPSCRYCNNYKTVYDIEYLRMQIGLQVQRARKYSTNFRLCERYGLITVNEDVDVVFYFETHAALPESDE